jgi:catechol 2,3-dioxygenase-like lactoylglutathione lyase family enzyme
MSHPVKGIDHCFSLVHDLDAAAEQFRRLGFTVSPRGMHSASKGSANHTIMFPEDYYELLGLLTRTPANKPRHDMLEAKGEGLHAIACRIDDARAAEAALNELGIATHGLGDFERPVDLPGGGEGVAAFSTVAFAPEEVPQGIVFMCQHRSPETVWLPELLEHANTACGLAGIMVLSEAPEREAEGFARLWAAGKVTPCEGGAVVETGENSAPLTLLTPEAFAARYPGVDLAALPRGAFAALQVKVRDMAAAKAALEQAGVPQLATRDGIAAGPGDAAGTVVEFLPA